MQNLILFFIGVSLTAFSWANDLDRAPKSFITPHGRAIFIDIKEAQYNIVYDLNLKKAEVVAQLQFFTEEEGMPLFDLYSDPKILVLDGLPVKQVFIESPDKVTKFRNILKNIQPGKHILEIKYPHLEEFTEYVSGGVVDRMPIDDYADQTFFRSLYH